MNPLKERVDFNSNFYYSVFSLYCLLLRLKVLWVFHIFNHKSVGSTLTKLPQQRVRMEIKIVFVRRINAADL